jgi:hypothetical protein
MRDETQSHSVWVAMEFVVARVVVLVVISSTPLVLLPIPVDLEQVYVLRERLWQYLQLSTSHIEFFLHSTSNMRIFLKQKLDEKRDRY